MEEKPMKGIKLGIVGICLGLCGIAFATNNIIAIGCTFIGMVLSIIGLFIKDK